MNTLTIPIAISSLVLFILVFGYLGVSLWAWTLLVALVLFLSHVPIWSWILFGIPAIVFNLPFLRRYIVTQWIIKIIRSLHFLPKISDTERAAIEAGNVWIEGEYFSGRPNLQRLIQEPYPQLNSEVQAFLNGPVEAVCRMASDWEITQRQDLPPQVWDYLKQQRFFGMMIPKDYGGLGFSYTAYSAVMTKLASRSFTHTATVGVTNSLGPAKLLLHYGTPEQKSYYLPRLASGAEIPCFALTEPHAGSDAASITSEGVVFKGKEGQLYLRLNWQKRYITLGAIATLLGLAFQLKDPDRLLGDKEQVGITCALIPTNTAGVILGRRHDPMGVPFYNSPTEGHDVIVPIDQIIGGVEQAGQGWKMLMQALAAGRGVGFPATCTGIAKLVTRVTGAYAVVRRQFGLPIGRFEGIEAPLARIGSFTYVMDAMRLYTCGAVERGEQPAVVSAIAKYSSTELARLVVNDGMDLMGGAGICRGPRNLLANVYIATPIPITVEGSNILTRTLMIFGQGAIRCHPYFYDEIEALHSCDLNQFDRLFWKHLGLVVQNSFRAVLLNLSRGHLALVPAYDATSQYYRKLAWAAATFALLTDLTLISLGGSFKRREQLSGRFADVLCWMYLATATLRRYEAEGQRSEDLAIVHWALHYAFAQIQQGVAGILTNLPVPVLGKLLQYPIAFWWRLNPIGALPSDDLTHQVAQTLQQISVQRDRLTAGIYLPTDPTEALGRLENAFRLLTQTEPILSRIKQASRDGILPSEKPEQLIATAYEAGIIQAGDVDLLRQAEIARNDAIQVDSFTLEEYDRHQKYDQTLVRSINLIDK